MNREQSMIERLREGMRSLREENTALLVRITELEKALTISDKLKDRLCELAGAPRDIMEAINLLGYRAGSCDWMPDEGYDYTCMITSCGEIYVFDDGYEDGDHKFCSNCGRKIHYNPPKKDGEG